MSVEVLLPITRTDLLLKRLGDKIRALRLAHNWTREEMSGRSGIPLSTLRRLETTGQGSTKDMIRAFRVLSAMDDLQPMFEPPPVDPYELIKIQKKFKVRERASKRKD